MVQGQTMPILFLALNGYEKNYTQGWSSPTNDYPKTIWPLLRNEERLILITSIKRIQTTYGRN